ncbi:hypothetical protein HanRHA438_Chr16g0764241 [Helianthus annuus]|nr:hypothetical protein HanIR_Chr16g0817551 [Helianthus annuus]KAJ0460733.1 hypothetical protein HanHA89_Chr16g0664241 [Helianthus annuus]KAJ0836201.1 hypothetical protein HanRHA438_Chr16g0764241 [Helianthus annuus]
MFCVILDMLCDLEQWIICVLISDIRFIIRIRIRNFGYPKVGYPKFRIRIRIVKSTIRNVRISDFRISEISDIRF